MFQIIFIMFFVVLAAIVEKKMKYLKKLLGSDPAVAEISLLSCSFIFKFSIVHRHTSSNHFLVELQSHYSTAPQL